MCENRVGDAMWVGTGLKPSPSISAALADNRAQVAHKQGGCSYLPSENLLLERKNDIQRTTEARKSHPLSLPVFPILCFNSTVGSRLLFLRKYILVFPYYMLQVGYITESS